MAKAARLLSHWERAETTRLREVAVGHGCDELQGFLPGRTQAVAAGARWPMARCTWGTARLMVVEWDTTT